MLTIVIIYSSISYFKILNKLSSLSHSQITENLQHRCQSDGCSKCDIPSGLASGYYLLLSKSRSPYNVSDNTPRPSTYAYINFPALLWKCQFLPALAFTLLFSLPGTFYPQESAGSLPLSNLEQGGLL